MMTSNNPKNILAIDTAFIGCAIALAVGDGLWQKINQEPRQQSKQILTMIDQLLDKGDISLKAIDGFAVGIGPGSFTGVRIGLSVIKTLAYVFDRPIAAFSSLQLMAQCGWLNQGLEDVIVLQDARMQQFYMGHYCLNSENLMQATQQDRLIGYTEVDQIKERPIIKNAVPDGKGMIALAKAYFAAGKTLDWVHCEANYVRQQVTS